MGDKILEFSETDDRELVGLLKKGSHAAFEKLYARYKYPLLRYCKQYLNDRAAAEDVVQDIFLQLWETRETLNITSSFLNFVYTSAKNRIFNIFRQFDIHERYAQNIIMHVKDSTNETEDAIIDNDYTALLNQLMECLPPMQKEVFRLHRIEGLTYMEIADLLKISVENARKHASLSIKKMKDVFTQFPKKQLIMNILLFFL